MKGMKKVRAGSPYPWDLTGWTFFHLGVLKTYRGEDGLARCECVCVCKTTKTVQRGNLLNGSTLSCGCWMRRRLPQDSRTKYRTNDERLMPLYTRYERSAKKTGREWTLSFDAFCKIVKSDCFYTGRASLANKQTYGGNYRYDIYANGIDRWNNDRGYTPDNGVACASEINFFKKDYDGDEFIALCAEVVRYQIAQGRLDLSAVWPYHSASPNATETPQPTPGTTTSTQPPEPEDP